MKKRYLVIVKKQFVRDAQVALKLDADPMDNNWGDVQAELILGTFEADDRTTAIQNAAIGKPHIRPEMMDAYLLATVDVFA